MASGKKAAAAATGTAASDASASSSAADATPSADSSAADAAPAAPTPKVGRANPHVEKGPAPKAPAKNQKSISLTQRALEGFFEQKVADAALLDKVPKDLIGLDPAKRAAVMCGRAA